LALVTGLTVIGIVPFGAFALWHQPMLPADSLRAQAALGPQALLVAAADAPREPSDEPWAADACSDGTPPDHAH